MAGPERDRISVKRHRLLDVETYDVTADELDQIGQEGMQVGQDFQFASISLTAGIAFLIPLLTEKRESLKEYVFYLVVTITGFVFALYFGQMWYRGRRTGRSIIQRIKEREIAPLGEEGKEIKSVELSELPSEEASGAKP